MKQIKWHWFKICVIQLICSVWYIDHLSWSDSVWLALKQISSGWSHANVDSSHSQQINTAINNGCRTKSLCMHFLLIKIDVMYWCQIFLYKMINFYCNQAERCKQMKTVNKRLGQGRQGEWKSDEINFANCLQIEIEYNYNAYTTSSTHDPSFASNPLINISKNSLFSVKSELDSLNTTIFGQIINKTCENGCL